MTLWIRECNKWRLFSPKEGEITQLEVTGRQVMLPSHCFRVVEPFIYCVPYYACACVCACWCSYSTSLSFIKLQFILWVKLFQHGVICLQGTTADMNNNKSGTIVYTRFFSTLSQIALNWTKGRFRRLFLSSKCQSGQFFQIPYFAKSPLTMFSNNNMCLHPVSELPKNEKCSSFTLLFTKCVLKTQLLKSPIPLPG